jgi:hypothetical protein
MWASRSIAVFYSVLRRASDRALIETEEIVLRRVVWRCPQVLNSVKDIRPHPNFVASHFDMEAVVATVDHVCNLHSRVVPELPLRIDAADMSDVFPRTMRVWFGDTRDLVCHILAPRIGGEVVAAGKEPG